MKIKVRPEDFIVNEVIEVNPSEKGEYGLFILKKRGWNTLDALSKISRRIRIPTSEISYGGKKDRYGLTSQYITIRKPPVMELIDKSYSIKLIGFTDTRMGPHLIRGNNFEITVRDLNEDEINNAMREIEFIRDYGYPNYFDDQRFGSYDPIQGFIGEKIIKRHFNGALKIYLTHIHPEDKGDEKRRKRFIYEHYGRWKECLSMAKTEFERLSFSYLMDNPDGFLPLLQRIPSEEMSLFFSAYQSFLWNEVLRRLISRLPFRRLSTAKGIAGDYVFYKETDSEIFSYLKDLIIPLPSSKMEIGDEDVRLIYDEVFNERGIKRSMFNLRSIRQAFFKSFERNAIVIPQSLSFEIRDDEIYNGKKTLHLRFFLRRGSYGTMLIKRIFSGT